MKQTATSFAEEFSATHQALSDVRRQVGAWLRTQGHDSAVLVADIEVVLSELGANVVDHTSSPWIRLAMELTGYEVTVEVSNQGSALVVPNVEDWGDLVEGTRGRGLRIVRAVCTTVVVTGDEQHTHIRCGVPVCSPNAS